MLILKIEEITQLLEANFNVKYKKDKFRYPDIQTKEDILKPKKYFQELRNFQFIMEMKSSQKKASELFIGIILSHNSSDLLSKIASKLIKNKGYTSMMQFQTNSLKWKTGTKLMVLDLIVSNEIDSIKEQFIRLNNLFKEFQAVVNKIADEFCGEP